MGYRSDILGLANISMYAELDETAGTNAVDDAGAGADGTYSGGFSLNATPGPIADGIDTGGWVDLNGSTGQVTFPDHADRDLGDGAQTGIIWFMRDANGSTEEIFVDKGSNAYSLSFNSGTVGRMGFLKSGVALICESTVAPSISVKHMAAWTKNGSAVHLYLDGVDVTGTVTNATLADTASSLLVGVYHAGGFFFNGKVGRLALVKGVLTAGQIAALWATGSGLGISPAVQALGVAQPAPAVLPSGITIAAVAALPFFAPNPGLSLNAIIGPQVQALGMAALPPVVQPSSILATAQALGLTIPAPAAIDQRLVPAAQALGMTAPAPNIAVVIAVVPPTLPLGPSDPIFSVPAALTFGMPSPVLSPGISPVTLILGLASPAPFSLTQPLVLAGMAPAALNLVGLAPSIFIPVHRLRDIQYHAIVYTPDGNGGPGIQKLELDADMLNVTWQQGLNFPGQAAFSMSRYNQKLTQFRYMIDHIKIFREDSRATKCVFAGKIVRPSISAQDAVIYCWDYAAFLQRSRTGFKVMYKNQQISAIVAAEWAIAKAADRSVVAFINTGVIETPLGLDAVTPITTNNQFGVNDFDRLYLFNAMAEISMANTANTVSFEITREAPHTFNFWKNRSVQQTSFDFGFPGNLVDYDHDPGNDQIVNDLATVIIDPQTGGQVEYSIDDTGSMDVGYRRLQSATTIKTLFGLNAGTIESDQQKAALARLLTISAGIPRVVTAFPRQGEITPFHGWNLGDSFKTRLQKADKTGLDIDEYLRITGSAAAWTPDAGELQQHFLR